MIHFNAELWNIHQLFVLQVLYEKKRIPTKKKQKNWPGQQTMSRQNSNITSRSMSQQGPTERKPKMKTVATQFEID